MLTLIEGGNVYAPAALGRQSILVANDRIEKIGTVDRSALDRLGVEYDVVDAAGCLIVPGLVDPHEHLLGGSGEGGPEYQTPMLLPHEIVRAGITTVVGTLGVDTTMKTMPGLLARVKALKKDGLSAWMWSGGYNVPPTTVLDSVRNDMIFIEEVVGAGEIAISDERGLNQSAQELAKLVRDTYVGGLLSGKAGITHFHVGKEATRLKPLRELIEDFEIKPEWLYPTHIQRTNKLMDEAIALANAGAHVDMDVVEQDIAKKLRYYLDNGGPLDKLTVSSDSDSSTPDIYFDQFCGLVVKHKHPLEQVLPMFSTTAAKLLKLSGKGRLEAGCDADILVLEPGSLEIRHVIARGEAQVINGTPVLTETFIRESYRNFRVRGEKFDETFAAPKER